MDFNAYYDTRDFNVFTLNLLANLPYRVQYFSLTNIANNIGTNQNFDANNYLSEQNLRWQPTKAVPLDLSFQWFTQSGNSNDLARFGLRWRLHETPFIKTVLDKIGLKYWITFHGFQTDFKESPGWGTQIEHVYLLPLFPKTTKNRLYVSGFADHNLLYGTAYSGNNHRWVTEHQLGIRLIDQLHMVFEFRRNEFFPQKKNGLGMGLQYKIIFR